MDLFLNYLYWSMDKVDLLYLTIRDVSVMCFLFLFIVLLLLSLFVFLSSKSASILNSIISKKSPLSSIALTLKKHFPNFTRSRKVTSVSLLVLGIFFFLLAFFEFMIDVRNIAISTGYPVF